MTAITTKPVSRAGLWALLFKLGPKFMSFAVKLLKGLKLGKVGLAAGSFAGYALVFNWKFALVLMASIFFHELGHIWAMKRHGMKTKGVYFLPFLGAAAVTEEAFPTRRAEVVIALMGPVWGLILALLTFDVYALTEEPMYAALAGWMGMVNLFNLLPINPLDGGRVIKSIAYSISARLGLWALAAGLVACFLLASRFGLGLVMLLILAGLAELYEERRQMLREDDRRRIIDALAKKFGVAATAEDVIAKITSEVPADAEHAAERIAFSEEIAMEAEAVCRPTSPLIPYLLELVPDDRNAGKTVWRWRRRYPWYATVMYLDLLGPEKLAAFLRQRIKPKMSLPESGGAFLAHVALAALLVALMAATAHVPGADLALQVFTD